MNLWKQVWNSCLGCKLLMSISGLVFIGFIVAHLSGNLLVFKGPEALNAYAELLHNYSGVLWVFRSVLILSLFVHVASALRLSRLSSKARPVDYKKRDYRTTNLASRTMMLSGLVLLAFIVYHLAHLTFQVTHQEFALLDHHDIYSMLIFSFKSPYVSSFYVLSIILLMMHLSHGIKSFLQTLGLCSKSLLKTLNNFAVIVSVALACGFISIPVAIFFEFIK
jgi:succinate dehydrogenase / fumarate reductase, cytochrome b subunit